jgi:D-alanyl-lipoteichoic acid acyltransferase DltB (MBOAT superfamily)
MLFNSYIFLFAFLPVVLLLYPMLERRGLGNVFLLIASYVFYSWGEKSYLAVLVVITLSNYAIGRGLVRSSLRGKAAALWFVGGLLANLLTLALFKYANFLVETLNAIVHTDVAIPKIALPLGISFFTFHALAYVIETRRSGRVEESFTKFALFLSFFPHMVAGPILRPQELLPQFGVPLALRRDSIGIARGLTLFSIGLFKKACLADSVAPYANAAFAITQGAPHTILDSWIGVLAYTMQIYFDFSGYSDMALGLALMLGIRLPLNFNSPYRATSLIAFWRRWHMTLSRFLRDYLYISLGGNRRGTLRRYANLFITMALGGLWHGANWTFVIWGVIHGLGLCVNHFWDEAARRLGLRPLRWVPTVIVTGLQGFATFLFVSIAWIFFGLNANSVGPITITDDPRSAVALLAVCLLVVWIAPNSQKIVGYGGLTAPDGSVDSRFYVWAPTLIWAFLSATALVLGIVNMSNISEFIYFHF